MTDIAPNGGAFYMRPSFSTRFWQALGFGRRAAPRPDEDELAEGWAPSWFMVGTIAHLDWRDRFRVLISGNLKIEQAVKTDVLISRSRTTSAIGVLPPGAHRRRGKWL